MDIQVKVYKVQDQSYVSLVDHNSVPVSPYSSVYSRSYLASVPFNTQLRYAYELKFILKFFHSKGIDLVERAADGTLLSYAELKAFFSAVKFTQESGLNINTVDVKAFTNKQLENAIHANRISDARVKSGTSKGRIKRLVDYLINFLFDEFHADQSIPLEVIEHKQFIERKCKSEIQNQKDFNQNCHSIDEAAIPPNKMVELLEIITPHSPNNPFKHSKFRNSLIVKLLLDTGIRSGAAAKMKISDCKFHGSFDQITIYRTPNDPTDSRSRKPQQKTKSHAAFVLPNTLHEIKHYIDTTRSRFEGAKQHDFVFVSEMNSQSTIGEPLSLSSINAIFKTLSKALNFRLHPHLLRHNWNSMFDDFARAKGLSSHQIEDLRKYSMGWSENSDMAKRYNEYKLYLRAQELAKERQNELTSAK